MLAINLRRKNMSVILSDFQSENINYCIAKQVHYFHDELYSKKELISYLFGLFHEPIK